MEKKETIIRFHWGREAVSISIGFTILSAALLMTILNDGAPPRFLKYTLALLLAAPIISGLFIAPLYIAVNDDKVRIRKPLASVEIPVRDIVSVQKIHFNEIRDAIRTFGSGGLFGFVGYFKNNGFGRFLMYATETKNLVLIRTDRKSYIVSCRNPEAIVSKLQ